MNLDDGLDLSEINSELKALNESELDTTNESLLWEQHKSRVEFEKIEDFWYQSPQNYYC